MELDFFNVLFTVLSLVILVIPSFILVKAKMLPDNAENALSTIVLYVCQPVLMFVSFQKATFSKAIAKNMLIVFAISLAVHLIMVAFVYLVVKGKSEKEKVVRFASVFSNCGYMGIPFLQMLFKNSANEIFIYAGIVLAVFNLVSWSIGVYMLTGNVKDMSFKKVLLNPTVIAVFLGIILFVTVQQPLTTLATEGSRVDVILTKFMGSLQYLADAVTPLAMMVIGIKLAKIKLKDLFVDKWAYLNAVYKLLVMSLITIALVAFLPIDNLVKYTLFFLLSMPSATGTVLFAVRYGGDGESASVYVLLSTVLSIATLPLMFLLLQVLC